MCVLCVCGVCVVYVCDVRVCFDLDCPSNGSKVIGVNEAGHWSVMNLQQSRYGHTVAAGNGYFLVVGGVYVMLHCVMC